MKTLHGRDIPRIPYLWYILCCTRNEGQACLQGIYKYKDALIPDNASRKLKFNRIKWLVKKGLASGCLCGCRGDFRITEKGKEYLKKNFEPTNRLPNL